MTQRVVERLEGSMSQTFTLANDENYNVAYIRPLLYVYNSPAGTFTLTVTQGTFTQSVNFTASDIQTALGTSDDYFYAWYRLNFTDQLSLKKGNFTITLSSSGYTFSESAWLGWVQEHEFRFNDLSYTPASDDDGPLSTQLFVYRKPESL